MVSVWSCCRTPPSWRSLPLPLSLTPDQSATPQIRASGPRAQDMQYHFLFWCQAEGLTLTEGDEYEKESKMERGMEAERGEAWERVTD